MGAPMTDLQHRPRWEEGLPGQRDFLVCELDDETWPCDHELQLRQEPPEEVMTVTDLHEDDDLLTPGEVATMFKVDPKTVTRWVKAGKIAAAERTLGGHRRYRYSDIRAAADAARNR